MVSLELASIVSVYLENYDREGDIGLESPGSRVANYIGTIDYILRVSHNEICSFQSYVGTHDWS